MSDLLSDSDLSRIRKLTTPANKEKFALLRHIDALAAKHEQALAIERGKLEAADAENDRLAARVAKYQEAMVDAMDELLGAIGEDAERAAGNARRILDAGLSDADGEKQ